MTIIELGASLDDGGGEVPCFDMGGDVDFEVAIVKGSRDAQAPPFHISVTTKIKRRDGCNVKYLL